MAILHLDDPGFARLWRRLQLPVQRGDGGVDVPPLRPSRTIVVTGGGACVLDEMQQRRLGFVE